MNSFSASTHNRNPLALRKAPLMVLAWLTCFSLQTVAQNCPPNIDFETGTFANWTCYTGSVAAVGSSNVFSISPAGGPVPERHTMYSAGSGLTDQYGGFPVNCPNGSGHSIRLGNNTGGGEAEGISYEFTIPAGQNEYSLIYHYAVVFQDPNHQEYQQPRMETEITNVSDGNVINCASFSFRPYGTPLPGFFPSTTSGTDGTPVWCKNWSAVSINLDNLAGKTIRLLFRTADCTFRRHFGYAYIDVNSGCSSQFEGATYCNDDTTVNITAPFGYQKYTWFTNDFSQVLGTEQTLSFNPPPPSGTQVAVEVVPYDGYGCLDTLYARLVDTLKLQADAGPDVSFCNTPVMIGTPARPGTVYSWSPPAALSSVSIANPMANPDSTTLYVLNIRHNGGGCLSTDSVVVRSAAIDRTLRLIGKDAYCLGNPDSAVLEVIATDSIQWMRNGTAIRGANRTRYRVTQSGLYHALLYNSAGCVVPTASRTITIDQAKRGIRYPVKNVVMNAPSGLTARPIGDTAVWNPAVYLNSAIGFTPQFRGPVDQQYLITISTKSGCVTVDTVLVKPYKEANIYVPTAFTPDGDGRNDRLRPVLVGVTQLTYFRVYNRWGQLLYQSRDEEPGWDGTVSGRPQGTGVVVWIAEGKGEDGKTYTRKGTCVLVR